MSGADIDFDDATLQELSETDIADIVDSIDPDVSTSGEKGACCASYTWFTVSVRACVCACTRVCVCVFCVIV